MLHDNLPVECMVTLLIVFAHKNRVRNLAPATCPINSNSFEVERISPWVLSPCVITVRAKSPGGGGGVLPIVGCMGRPRLKGVPFLRLQYTKG